jgi:hypothetical protein
MGTTKQLHTRGWFCRQVLYSFIAASWLAGVPLARAAHTTNPPPRSGHAVRSTNQPATRGAGITYSHDDVPDVPWSIHIAKVDRSRADIGLETTMGGGNQFGMSLVSDQVKTIAANVGKPLAAINGDFYRSAAKYPGDPHGVQIVRGELMSGPDDRSCFWIDAAGNPQITNVQSLFRATLPDGTLVPFGLNEERASGTAVLYTTANGSSTRTSSGVELILKRGSGTNWLPLAIGPTYDAQVQEVRAQPNSPLTSDTMVLSFSSKITSQVAGVKVGDTIRISTATSPDLAGSQTAIGGWPALVRGRKTTTIPGLPLRHPRTAIGWNKDHFFLVEVDGRQRTSAGMTLPELATYMLNLGCDEAMNLDGGGSATMWFLGNVINSPSEGRERPAANALVVVKKPQPAQK